MQCHDAGGHRRERHPAEACSLDNLGEGSRLGKPPNRLDEVLIGLRVASGYLPEARDQLERIEVVKCINARYVDGGEFQAEEAAAELERAMGFGERPLDARHVADAEGDGDTIEAPISVGQLFGISLLEVHHGFIATGDGAVAADVEHGGVDVAEGDGW